ncbi:hypothetical protein RJ640_022051 [Escallonia rubra]|uniref:DUF4371 domain-containing protein n=1 Tax=Escallonia rubra TaxID=112253 RepID=A0AA88QLI7_9ASTE|nr:hypothetical protein RJ640_022051 [Escallonia rubra]
MVLYGNIFFHLVHVPDTTSLTLKMELSDVLSSHNLSVESIRGQGYDGASNIRGHFNGLQALFAKESPFAYYVYVHCLAPRRLWLTLGETKNLSDHPSSEEKKIQINPRFVSAQSKVSDKDIDVLTKL